MRFYRARAAGVESGAGSVQDEQGVPTSGVQGVLAPLTNSGDLTVPVSVCTSVESLNSGLTRTTPTLTPTTLRNIEETFMELDRSLVTPPVSHQHQAGFVTPQVAAGVTYSQLDQTKWQGGVTTVTASRGGGGGGVSSLLAEPSPRVVPQGHRRGGRRPKDDDELSPEEEQRRRMRRERNKQAAARCRRRRMDLTNTLQMETEELENERKLLEREIQELQAQREELHFLMEAHRPCCKLSRDKENAPKRKVIVKHEPDVARLAPIKSEPLPSPSPSPAPAQRARPTSLSVAPFASAAAAKELTGPGVPINTPSHGLGLNFDSLMEGGTGLTPITSASLVPLLIPAASSASLATPVVSTQADARRGDLLSPGVRELVSL
ncbi:transcription factor kayak-like [Pollicipes pollicipes]|uniref:transcription factor kayak-like n=1 Tax=Pollicipes pollicipes TaxID=41117 RepID=UPI001885683B|nr:transcription factor kayak-like [Pollicipes pollicipes]